MCSPPPIRAGVYQDGAGRIHGAGIVMEPGSGPCWRSLRSPPVPPPPIVDTRPWRETNAALEQCARGAGAIFLSPIDLPGEKRKTENGGEMHRSLIPSNELNKNF